MHLYKRFFAVMLVEFLSQVSAFPERAAFNSPKVNSLLSALRRSDTSQETYSRELQCQIDMVGFAGEYYYTSRGSGDTCIIYFLVEGDQVVEIEFLEANFQCEDEDTHVQWFDGWSMGIGSFPSVEDHPMNISERIQTICADDGNPLIFRANQNAAMMTFKLTNAGDSIRIALKPRRNPEPCNVMAQDPSGVYTLSNYGSARNCSLSVIYPTRMSVVDMRVGATQSEATLGCKHAADYVEFMAGNGLDSSYLRQDAVLCGSTGLSPAVHGVATRAGSEESMESTESQHQSARNVHLRGDLSCAHGLNINLNCQNSVVRLVSEAGSDNSVTVEYRRTFEGKNDCDSLTDY